MTLTWVLSYAGDKAIVSFQFTKLSGLAMAGDGNSAHGCAENGGPHAGI